MIESTMKQKNRARNHMYRYIKQAPRGKLVLMFINIRHASKMSWSQGP